MTNKEYARIVARIDAMVAQIVADSKARSAHMANTHEILCFWHGDYVHAKIGKRLKLGQKKRVRREYPAPPSAQLYSDEDTDE